MIINAQLQNRARNGFSTRAYSYRCDIPGIKVGDVVQAPTSSGVALARVSKVDVQEWELDKDILDMLKTVTDRAEEPVNEPESEQIGLDELAVAPDEPAVMTSISADVIRVTQLPVIEEQLRSVKTDVEAVTREAMSMICTEDTVQAVKAKRADLNKIFAELDTRRKEVKAAVMAPYERFEAVFKECITEPFKVADTALKDKVVQVETVQKDSCEARLRLYFDEMCQLHGVDFIHFEQAGIKIDMASAKAKTPKRLMDKLGEFVVGVAVGMDQIHQMNDAAEIMAEYKKCLNVGQAVAIVQDRHRKIEEEREAAEAREANRRRQEEAVAKVEAVAPPVAAEPPSTDPIIPRCVFACVNARRSQLIKLRDFLKQEGIQYE